MKDRIKTFLKAAGLRAIRTVAQTFISAIGTTALLSEVDWKIVFSTAALAGIVSILNSIVTGLPEIEVEDTYNEELSEDNDEVN